MLNVCVEEFFFFYFKFKSESSCLDTKKSLIEWSIFFSSLFFFLSVHQKHRKSNINCTLRITYFLITLTIVFVVVAEVVVEVKFDKFSHVLLLDCNLWLENELMSRRGSHKREEKVQSSKQFFTLYILYEDDDGIKYTLLSLHFI